MAETKEGFFPGASRRVILGSPTLQTSNRRICIPIRMPLDEDGFAGMPDWISDAYSAVYKSFTKVSPEVEQIADVTLAFANDKPKGELFAPPSSRVNQAELRGFSVVRTDDPADPEIELQFKAFAPYSRAFWAWIGEMAGKEVYMAFPASLGVVKDEGPVTGELPLAEAKEPVEKAAKKSGPKDLAAEHLKHVGK